MNNFPPVFRCFQVLALLLASMLAIQSTQQAHGNERQRVVILADMGNEPDEVQQMIHMVTCCNEFDVEGLIAVTGKYLRPESRIEYRRTLHPELFHEIIDAYEKVLPNLKIHAEGWPTTEHLRSCVATGQNGYGIQDTGEGKSSQGSKLLESVAGNDDPRPLWVVVNAGSNTLAQAIIDYERTHTATELRAFIDKLRVFENGAQDNAGAWICNRYPSIHWIRSNYQTYAYGGPGGKDGNTSVNLGPSYWGENEYSVEGQLAWQKLNIMEGHGPLGDIYPERRFGIGKLAFIEGGGTIPWMGLVNKGLFDINQPSWGGWSGRFSRKKVADFWSRHKDIKKDEAADTPFYVYREVSDHWVDERNGNVYADNYSPIWRWREAMYNDQLCRMDWCVKTRDEANHHPIAAIDGDATDSILHLRASAGERISLDASHSTDPDEDSLEFKWWIYPEAGTYAGEIEIEEANAPQVSFKLPSGATDSQIHLILEVRDVNPVASLYDYRRIVIEVDDRIVGHKPMQK